MDLRQEHQELVELARRIVLRHQQGRLDIAAELIMRALATSDADHTFAFALALADEALDAVKDIRLDATEAGQSWRPAMTGPTGELITAENTDLAPIPLAMRLLETMHHGLNGDREALHELGVIYEVASRAPDTVFHGMFAALATYAAHCRSDDKHVIIGAP